MAWIVERKRTGRHEGKKPWLAIHYRGASGCQRCKALRTTDPKVARIEKERIEAEVEGREQVPVRESPDAALEQFLGHLARRERLRAPTVEIYRRRLGPLFATLGRVPLARWTRRMLGDYLDRHPDWSPRTIQLTVNACQRFIRWCREEAYIDCPEFVGRSKGLVPEVHPRTGHEVFSLAEMVALLSKVRGEPRGNRWIDLATHLALWAALPFGDIRTLEWKHIDLRAGTLRKRRQKTNEMITVPIATPLRRALLRHPGISGRVVRHLPESLSSARKSLIRKVKKAGLAGRPKGEAGWHLLRHSMASALDRVGTTEATIGFILGHKPSTVTGRYIHAEMDRARVAMERLEERFYQERLELLRPRLEARQARRDAG